MDSTLGTLNYLQEDPAQPTPQHPSRPKSRQTRRRREKIPGPGLLWLVPLFGLLICIGTVIIAIVVPAPTTKGSFSWTYAAPVVGGILLITSICVGGILIRRKRRTFLLQKKKERDEMKRKIRDGIVEEMLQQQRDEVGGLRVHPQTTVRIGDDESGSEDEPDEAKSEPSRDEFSRPRPPPPPPVRRVEIEEEERDVVHEEGIALEPIGGPPRPPSTDGDKKQRRSLRNSALMVGKSMGSIVGEYFKADSESSV
jgi:hypothetical protein